MRELNSEVKQLLLAPFQAAEVRVRTQPYIAAYVTARVVMTRLDEVLPWQWSFHLKGPVTYDKACVAHQDGVLTIHGPSGVTLEFHDRGSAPPDIAKGQAKQAKHAVSDCFKRCAVHVGIGRYLYELAGLSGGRIPKPNLEKALAAVGYRGSWDDRHYGPVGGIREADLEDEEGDAGEADKIDGGQMARLLAAVETGGGSVEASSFRSWLGQATSNHTTVIEEILASDADGVIAKLKEIASKKKAA